MSIGIFRAWSNNVPMSRNPHKAPPTGNCKDFSYFIVTSLSLFTDKKTEKGYRLKNKNGSSSLDLKLTYMLNSIYPVRSNRYINFKH